MICNNCGNEISNNAKFCNKCGTVVGAPNNVQATQQINQDVNNVSQVPQAAPNFAQSQPVYPEAAATQVQQPVQQNANQSSKFAYPQNNVPVNQQPKNNNVWLIALLSVLIAIIIAAILVVFLVIKPFDNTESSTTTTATKITNNDDSSSNKNNSNNNSTSSTTKSVSCVAANGSTLSGTVRVKDGYVIGDSSTKLYTASEISALGLNEAEMCIAWNEPYARAGYHFKNSGLQAYFNSCSWYHDTGFTGTLSDTGGQNTNIIKGVAGSSSWKNLATY